MHLNTMLVLIVINIQHMKTLLLLQLIHTLNIYLNSAQRSTVLIHIRQCTTRKIFMMRRTKNKHSFYVIRTNNILISPRSRRTTVVKASMRTNQSLHPSRPFLLFGTIYILNQLGIQLTRCVNSHLRLSVYHCPAWRHCRDCFSMHLDIFFNKDKNLLR